MTATTTRRITFCLTRETERQLNELCDRLGESRSQTIVRCIAERYMLSKICHDPDKTIKPIIVGGSSD